MSRTEYKTGRIFGSLNLGLLPFIVCVFSVGCASLNSGTELAPPAGPQVELESYKVIFGNKSARQPKIYRGVLDSNITIREAIQRSGADKKYRSMSVDVARLTENGNVLKLKVEVDPESGEIVEQYNYAVHPGDEILVRPAPTKGMLHGVFQHLGN